MTEEVPSGSDAFPKKNPQTDSASPASALAHWKIHAWFAAYQDFAACDGQATLDAETLERYGMSAYLIGRETDFLEIFERAFSAHLAASEPLRAARCAFWMGLTLMFQGAFSRGNGWIERMRRITAEFGRPCVEAGYLHLPEFEMNLAKGDMAAALTSAEHAIDIGEAFGDSELVAIARHLKGRVKLSTGQMAEGMALLDDAMLSVTGGGLSPIVTGLIYCSVIDICQEYLAFERAREWTGALSAWCTEQPEMVAFTGRCMIHRAEILELDGDWTDAANAAATACRRLADQSNSALAGTAHYRQAEVFRLQGRYRDAEEHYREASRCGRDPQPGLALLRVAQGRGQPASSAIRRALDSAAAETDRIRLLPAYVEIMLETGEPDAARAGAAELSKLAGQMETAAVLAMAAQAQGVVDMAAGRAIDALGRLRKASATWQGIGACYHFARAKQLAGQAMLATGDLEGGQMELTAARNEFARLGAIPDRKRAEALLSASTSRAPDLLTGRQLAILRLIATGMTNRAIAEHLGLSQRTVDRHVSNILTRLDVPTRAAATAYAFAHGLIGS